MTISHGIFLGLGMVNGLVIGFLMAMVISERHRRRDVMHWRNLEEAPPTPLRADVEVVRPDPELSARRRAEVEAIQAGLITDLKAAGRDVDLEEVYDEAMRLATQADAEFGNVL